MDQLVIDGNGPLQGEVDASGAKNAALPVIAASLLSAQPLRVTNVPAVRDIDTLLELLRTLGCEVARGAGRVTVDSGPLRSTRAPYELVKTMRGSILLLGLQGARFAFDIPSVTGTENLMMAASLARGVTVLDNAAREPEVEDLARLLHRMGARVAGAGSGVVRVEGVAELAGCSHRVPPDRIETGTFLAAAAATRGRVRVTRTDPSLLQVALGKLAASGARVSAGADWIELDTRGRRGRAVSVSTAPYPAFPTDMQAQFTALNAVAEGRATVVENIFENRFMHVAELQRMGADIELRGNSAIVQGRERLQGAPVMATDLRASASLVIAAVAADGQSTIDRVYHLDRGYANIDQKLARLGARIRRV